jgi:hypothetical protein
LSHAEHVLEVQRALRERLLSHRQIAWRPARDLAAHMLLHSGRRQRVPSARGAMDARGVRRRSCRRRLRAAACDVVYRPQAEALRSTRRVPSMVGAAIDAADGGVQRRMGVAPRRRLLATSRRNHGWASACVPACSASDRGSIIATALRDHAACRWG